MKIILPASALLLSLLAAPFLWAAPPLPTDIPAPVQAGGAKPAEAEAKKPATDLQNPVAIAAAANPVLSPDLPLTEKAKLGVDLSKKWQQKKGSVFLAEDGKVTFVFNTGVPEIVAAPLNVCDIELEPGEVVNELNAGDASRWKFSQASSGEGAQKTTHIIVRPDDAAEQTTCIVTTNFRTYRFHLVSRQNDCMLAVGFSYPERAMEAFNAARAKREALETIALAARMKRTALTSLPTDSDPITQPVGAPASNEEMGANGPASAAATSVSNLNFGYSVKGKAFWRPVRVFDDGERTFIDLPMAIKSSEAPMLLAIENDKERQINYRVKALGKTVRYIADGVHPKIMLASGVGDDQTKVLIEKEAADNTSDAELEW